MKRKWILGIILLFVSIGIAAFLMNFLNKGEQVEFVGYEEYFPLFEIDSFEEVCEWSDTIVKAKYIKRESFDNEKDIFVFKLEDDYIGNVDEKRIHVYEVKESSFIRGKSYYLFMSSFRSPIYPHVSYARTEANFLVGETKNGDSDQYTFYKDRSWGLDKVGDISKYIETEIVAKGAYMKTERKSLDEAVMNADAIYKIKVESVKIVNRFVSNCTYTVIEPLRERYSVGKPRELPTVLAPSDAKVGDKFIILAKYDEKYQSYGVDYSSEHFIYPLRSSEARYIIKSVNK